MTSAFSSTARAASLAAAVAFLALAGSPQLHAVDRYSSQVCDKKQTKLESQKSLENQRLKGIRPVKVLPNGKGRERAMDPYKLPAERYTSSFPKKPRRAR